MSIWTCPAFVPDTPTGGARRRMTDTSGDWDLVDALRDTEAENVLSVEQLAHCSEATTNGRFQNSGHGEIIHAIGTGRRPRCSRRAGLYRRRSTARGATDRIKKGMPRTQIATPDLTALFSGGVALPAFELRENRCETTDMADDRAPYVQSSGFSSRLDEGHFTMDIRLADFNSDLYPKSW
jgi:hypothetical protein